MFELYFDTLGVIAWWSACMAQADLLTFRNNLWRMIIP